MNIHEHHELFPIFCPGHNGNNALAVTNLFFRCLSKITSNEDDKLQTLMINKTTSNLNSLK